ncbi:MFS transporter [Streptomyces sp. WMMC500]|uniref:MFS transporter n=1 Tax=Streptomyces sp. WMMC500 TaxID=3015154 RepID=UPI00248AFA0F|nr:MFS transporter [Streptomyces sp. WMMC500]WBB57815.1 MFS transporter [Streptomyces sp. WMMC500]
MSAPSYAAVLRIPHASRTFGAALLGRLSYGMVPLALLLSVRDATGSYAAAGAAMACFGATSVTLSPARAGLIDRHGPRRALPPMAAAYAVLLAALGVVTASGAAGAAGAVVLAAAAGAFTPPLGPVMRVLWSDLVPPGLLSRAYSLDSVAEELLLVTGPLLVGAVVTAAPAPVGLGAGAGLVLAGTLALVTSPVARARTGSGRPPGKAPEPDPAPVPAPESAPASVPAPASAPGILRRNPAVRRAAVGAAGVGMCLGALPLLAVASADEHGADGLVPWILAAMSAGSAVGGLVHGAVAWRSPRTRRLPVLAAALALMLAATGLSPHPYALVACAAVFGLFVAPGITTAYLIADESAAPDARTKAGAWVNTALNAGTSAATAATGLLIGRVPLPLCFVLAALPTVLAAAVLALTVRRTRRPSLTSPRPGRAAVEADRGDQEEDAAQRRVAGEGGE